MSYSRQIHSSHSHWNQALLAICIIPLGFSLIAIGSGSAQAQDKSDKPYDLKPLVPPAFVLPPNSQLNPGTVGGTRDPYTTAPLQNPSKSPTQSAPGIKLTIPR
jgi:hypothetical protein